MPHGDAQRTSFPEMVERLRSEWHEGLSMPALIGLRDELDGMLHRIRASRNFRNPVVTCRRCGMTSAGAEPHVSVRALILALARFGISSKEQARALEKAWAEYRKQRRLDIAGEDRGELPGCLQPLTIRPSFAADNLPIIPFCGNHRVTDRIHLRATE